MFKALVLDKTDGAVTAAVGKLNEAGLPAGDVTVSVAYSTLNWKDGAIVKGAVPLVRRYPHVPGVDFAGTVAESRHPAYKPGDPVVLTGWGVGEGRWGGFAELARVEGDWLVPLPEGLTLKTAMALGTAGLAAMLAVMSLEEQGLTPEAGEVLVTGAAGGVGSVAIALLAARGYRVVAASGRVKIRNYLTFLGAQSVIGRHELANAPVRPLDSARWAACIDSVGGKILARVLSQMRDGGTVAAVGLAGGNETTVSLMPFLLRGARLIGVGSARCPQDRRRAAWARLAAELPRDRLEAMTSEAALEDLPLLAQAILDGRVRGRVVIDVKA